MEKDHAGDSIALEQDGLFIVHPDGTRENLLDYVIHPDRTGSLDCVKNMPKYHYKFAIDHGLIRIITCKHCGKQFLGIFSPDCCPACIDKWIDI